jgi:hypothetical protein
MIWPILRRTMRALRIYKKPFDVLELVELLE